MSHTHTKLTASGVAEKIDRPVFLRWRQASFHTQTNTQTRRLICEHLVLGTLFFGVILGGIANCPSEGEAIYFALHRSCTKNASVCGDRSRLTEQPCTVFGRPKVRASR